MADQDANGNASQDANCNASQRQQLALAGSSHICTFNGRALEHFGEIVTFVSFLG